MPYMVISLWLINYYKIIPSLTVDPTPHPLLQISHKENFEVEVRSKTSSLSTLTQTKRTRAPNSYFAAASTNRSRSEAHINLL